MLLLLLLVVSPDSAVRSPVVGPSQAVLQCSQNPNRHPQEPLLQALKGAHSPAWPLKDLSSKADPAAHSGGQTRTLAMIGATYT